MSDRGISLAEANDFKGDSRSSKGEMESGARLVENFPTAAQVGHEETCGGASDGNKQPDVESAADLREAEASQGPSAVEPTGFDLDMFAKQGVGHREHHEESAEDKLKFGHLDRTLEGASRLPVLDLGEADNSFPVGHDGMASDRATPAKAVADDGRLPVFLGGQETGAAVQAADRMIMGSSAGYASPETLRCDRQHHKSAKRLGHLICSSPGAVLHAEPAASLG